ncbi:NAD(P)/FAD-dependent oxidoreductase [Aliihoeflea sp. 40Bstr573]|uniref:NAD(P)/FAD-dependent oxidoreductase n=1 Tax=Aliihoeflea sp. 40Bstr573 TaxID=2696467 RepID=UPI0020950B08|nr:NAD(P)/FAD-dependent oxidoreductase [Aliihoeflea sp. 40Bstr573]MCO6387502.1 FAD-dependent oxidoreductase [Aliihoeflea sp. 40Bstr573]
MTSQPYDVAIVGAGFTGLAAAYDMAKKGLKVRVVEADVDAGGLAGTFEFSDGMRIEKFYHHWFNNDLYVPKLVRELGHEDDIVVHPSRNGMYFNGRHWRLTTPLDLLRFTALPFWDRIRLGLMVFRVRGVKDWKQIENLSVREWLEPIVGPNVYRVVWEPLIKSKFSVHAEDINAVWFWKKLVLRGSTRDKTGGEELAYFRGGFGRLAEIMVDAIRAKGGEVSFSTPVTGIRTEGRRIIALETAEGPVEARQFLFTPAFPIIADIFEGKVEADYLASLRRVRYLGNMCLVLRLNRSLSDTYWLNVNDPGFPFVGVIEHTNFDPPENYKGSHIAFLSKYLSVDDPVWNYSEDEYADFALEHLKRMFPDLDRSWIKEYRMWRSPYAQPVTERGYSQYVPGRATPFDNAFISTMAQVYPEDRGTNYAIREALEVSEEMQAKMAARADG